MSYLSQDPTKTLNDLIDRVTSKLAPPPTLKVSEWASAHRRLSSEASPEPGLWSNERTPYLVQIMDCLNDPEIETITVMTSAQVGKTSCIENILGYIMDMDPGPVMCVQPRVEDAEDFSKDRLDSMIRDTPRLFKIFGDQKSKTSGNTILKKKFPGGFLKMAGANSPASLAAKSIRYLLLDEIDRFPVSAKEEGDPIKLATKRTNNFYNKKIFQFSTPTIKGSSKIEEAFNNSDRGRLMVECPHCGKKIILSFKQLRYADNDASTAVYECQECSALIDEALKPMLLKGATFVKQRETKKHAGFWFNELYSPWRKWKDIVQDWLDAQGDSEKLKVFVNTSLAETWEIKGEAPEWKRIYQRREAYKLNIVPMRGCFLTAAVDVQKDRLEVEIKAWGERLENWSIDHRIFMGDPDKDESVWKKIDDLFYEKFESESGKQFDITQIGIDSGYLTERVYNFVRKTPPGRCIAIKGEDHLDTIFSLPKAMDVDQKSGKKLKRGLKVWSVGTHKIKSEFYGILKREEITDEELAANAGLFPFGHCHFPQYGEEYFKQITAESYVKGKRGKHEWVKTRERNEALDLHVYNRAVAAIVGADRFTAKQWERMKQSEPKAVKPPVNPTQTIQNNTQPARVSTVRRRSKWMEGID